MKGKLDEEKRPSKLKRTETEPISSPKTRSGLKHTQTMPGLEVEEYCDAYSTHTPSSIDKRHLLYDGN
jgi:hypothetical protein